MDLSYYVDFKSLAYVGRLTKMRSFIKTQNEFLAGLGIDFRFQTLLARIPDETTKRNFFTQVNRLVDPDEMGRVYKCFYTSKTPLHPFTDEDEVDASSFSN